MSGPGYGLTPFGAAILAHGDALAHPERLPGYAEAVAAIERGEDPSASPARPKRSARPRRTAAEVRASLDALRTERDRLGVVSDDPAASRLGAATAARQQGRLDRELVRSARLSERITAEEGRLALAEAREGRADRE